MSAKLIYKDIAVGADTDAAVMATGAGSKSDVSKLPFGVVHPDFATLELNKWGGSGSKKIYNGQEIALVSTAMSGSDCTFATPPSLTINFDSNYTTLGISFRFSTNSVDYASSITLAWYQGATQLDQKTFYPDGSSYFCENTVTAFNKLVMTINSTNLPGRYARLEQILFGVIREFDGREIGSVGILQEVNLISAELSINTLDWKLKSKTGVDFIFQLKQPVLAYNNSRLIGVFYIDDKAKRTAENSYEIPCCDAIGVLDGDDFSAAVYSDKNAAALMAEIVNGAFELDIDSSLSSATVSGLISDCTRREAFQQVAFAIGAVVDTSGSEKIRVYLAASSAPATIPASRVYVGGSVEQDSVVTAVVVTYHSYTAESGSSGDDVITVGGVTYVHTTGTVRVDNPNVTATDKPNVKPVADCMLVNASNAADVAARVYAYYQRRNTVSSRIVVDGEAPGDYVSIPTAWGTTMTGNIESMKLKLSNVTAADVTIKAVNT
jgi:hypothetical protein